jgi:hypothetical protein
LSYRGSSPFSASYAAFSSDESFGDMICNAENEGRITPSAKIVDSLYAEEHSVVARMVAS